MAPREFQPGALGVRPRAALVAVWMALGCLAGAARAADAPPVPPPTSPSDTELERLRGFLVGPDRTLPTRRDAAAALLDKDTDAARAILVEVLATPSEAAMAVLDVLASRPGGDEAFLDPLFNLLANNDADLRRQAALAFGAYTGSDRVVGGLKALLTDTARPPAVRLAALEGLAQIVDRRSIEALVEATADAAVARAAERALSDMTGLDRPPDGWAAWWKRHEALPEADFLRGLVRRFRAELRIREAALDTARARISRLLNEMYRVADAKERARLIREHLDDALPDVRAVAARQAALLAGEALASAGDGNGRAAYQDLLNALTLRLSDASPDVRAAAAEALAAWQETAAGPALLARLTTETMPSVRAAIAAALGTLRVTDAVPKLVAMLDSPHASEVIRAAGALGAIGERNTPGAAAVAAGLEPLGQLARKGSDARVREASCRALARIGHPGLEQVLVACLEDADAGVRFSAAQGLGNMGRVVPNTRSALTAHLLDDNRGVRQAVAAALAKLGGPETARRMAERLNPSGEADPAVRNALWSAVQALVAREEGPALAEELADVFMAYGGPESSERAAALLEAARAKYPAAEVGSERFRRVLEKLVEAHVAAGTPRRAVPALRQLLDAVPPDEPDRALRLKRQLGLVLLPDPDAGTLLGEVLDGTDPKDRLEIARAVHAQAETLLKTDQAARGLDLLEAFRQAAPDWGGTDATAALEETYLRLQGAAVAQWVAQISGTTEAEVAAATARLKALGAPAVRAVLDALGDAAQEGRTEVEKRLLTALEAVTGRRDHGYDPSAPLARRLAAIETWRTRLADGGQ